MRRFALAAVTVTILASLAPAPALSASSPIAPHGRSVPSWASAETRVGDVASTEHITFHVLLPFRDEAGARRFAYAISDPRSPMFRKFVSPEQFRARFAPTKQAVDAAASWLRASGFEVGSMPANRLVVPARGTVGAVERAFGVSMGRYRVGAQVLRSPDSAPKLPRHLAEAGVTVRGLDEGHALVTPGVIDEETSPPPTLPEEPSSALNSSPPAAVVYGSPCSKFDGEKTNKKLPAFRGVRHPAVACATTPQMLQAAYGVTPLLRNGIDGTGETIVMVGSHGMRTLEEDLEEWSRRRRLPPMAPQQARQFTYPGAFYTPDGYTAVPADPAPDVQSTSALGGFLRPTVWAVQSAMLFQTMRAIAPGANYLYAGSTSSLDLPYVTLLAVDGAWGDVIVNGWYTLNEIDTEPDTLLISRMGLQAAGTGISLLFAAGDLGDGTHHGNTSPSVAYPAHNPDITAVGSTSLILGKGGKYVRELGWAKHVRRLSRGRWGAIEAALFRGGGGGVSNIHGQPDYQGGVSDTVAVRQDGTLGRTVPDISVAGDAETGMLIGYTQRFPDGSVRYGERRVAANTASTALFGALLAVANHRSGFNHGFVNPSIYQLWKTKRTAYRDVVPSGKPKGGIRIDYTNGATPAGGSSTVLKMFEDFTSNRPRKGYDTSTGLGSPSPTWFASLG